MDGTIQVDADWTPGAPAFELGSLRVQPGRQGEIFSFAFAADALDRRDISKQGLDPDLQLFAGTQFPKNRRASFGMFDDASPDRWGETLIRRRFERKKRMGLIPKDVRLDRSDFLLGVHDLFRSGALRFKRSVDGAYLDDDDGSAAPPFVRLRELEAASRGLESDTGSDDAAIDEWLRLLLAPGASLGGARPKASVIDVDGNLWIAKFPSIRDRFNVGAWEFVIQELARRSGLRVPSSTAQRFASDQHTFMVRRFDRGPSGERIHFASAMTLTGHIDGDDASTGASYLEIAEVIASQGAAPDRDLEELWSRIVFNMMVSNTDDHLRNHGFVLEPGAGWRLSPAYDMNPVPGSLGLRLNVSENDNALDIDLAKSVAPYFRLKTTRVHEIVNRIATAVCTWNEVATTIGVSRAEQTEMADSFSLATSRS